MGILLPPVSQVTNTRINMTQHHRNRSLDSALQRIPEVSAFASHRGNKCRRLFRRRRVQKIKIDVACANIDSANSLPQVEVSSPNAEVESSPLSMSQAPTDAKDGHPELPVNAEPRTSDAGTFFLSYQLVLPLRATTNIRPRYQCRSIIEPIYFGCLPQIDCCNKIPNEIQIEHRNDETFPAQGFVRSMFWLSQIFWGVRSSGGETNNTMSHVSGICAINKSE